MGLPADYRRRSGRRDHQVVVSPSSTRPSGVGDQATVLPGHLQVIGNDLDAFDNPVHERLSLGPPVLGGEVDAGLQLGDSHSGNGYVVLVEDRFMEFHTATFQVNQERRVEEQPGHESPS